MTVYEILPLKETPAGGYKEIKVLSELIRAGLLSSPTFTDPDEVGRISFSAAYADLMGNELRTTLAG